MYTLAYATTLGSALCFGVASVLEQKATRQANSFTGLHLRDFKALLGNMPYLSGIVLDGLGFLCFIVAVRSLPLFFVQAVGTASIAVTAITAHFILGAQTTARDYRWMVILFGGLAALFLATGPESTTAIPPTTEHILLIASAAIAAGAIIYSKFLARHPQVAALASGLCFSVVATLTRILQFPHPWWHIIISPLAIILAINGVLGLALFTLALQKGSVTYVYSINFVTETIIPSLIGLMLLGDTPINHRWAILIIGLGVTICSTSMLTRGKEYLQHG